MAFLQGRGQVSMTKPAPNWKWNRLSLAAPGLSLGLQLCSWIAMWEQQSFHGASLICKSLNRWPATGSKPVSVVHRFSFCTIDRGSCYSIQHCHEKNVPTGVIFDQIFKFRSLLEASSLQGYISFQYQTWNDGMTDVQRPPTLTLRSRTGAAKPTLWPTLNPCDFTVPRFIFKTKTFSFSSKQALSNNVFGVKIGRTTTLRRLFKVINFRRSKFVCTLWNCPVFGMCAAGLATHLTTLVCPVARTQTIILQVVYCTDRTNFAGCYAGRALAISGRSSRGSFTWRRVSFTAAVSLLIWSCDVMHRKLNRDVIAGPATPADSAVQSGMNKKATERQGTFRLDLGVAPAELSLLHNAQCECSRGATKR